MNLNEILKAKNLDDDVIQSILDEMKANGIYLSSEENIDIRYGKLKTQHEGTAKQLTEAQALIENLQKSTKGQEEVQQQIAAYKQQNENLLAKLEETKFDAEAKFGLLSAKVDDVNYAMYVLKENMAKDGKERKVDENGKIPNWNELLSALQKQIPAHFDSSEGNKDGYKVLEPNNLKKGDGGEKAPTKEAFMAMGYEERMALKQKNETLYNQLVK